MAVCHLFAFRVRTKYALESFWPNVPVGNENVLSSTVTGVWFARWRVPSLRLVANFCACLEGMWEVFLCMCLCVCVCDVRPRLWVTHKAHLKFNKKKCWVFCALDENFTSTICAKLHMNIGCDTDWCRVIWCTDDVFAQKMSLRNIGYDKPRQWHGSGISWCEYDWAQSVVIAFREKV